MSSQKKRKTYSLNFKLDAVLYAEQNSISKAAEHYGVDRTQIIRWKKQKEVIEMHPNKASKGIKRVRSCKWPALEAHLKSWITSQRKEGHQVSGSLIIREARAHAIRMNIHDFKGSPHWIFQFIKRNRVVRRAVTSIGQKLPDDWEQKMKSFVEFVTKHKHQYALDQIGNMDEVPVCFDMPSKFTMDFQGTSDVRITTTGSEKSRFTVVLCVTANGVKLPAYIIFCRKTIPKGNYPSNVIISANEKSCMTSVETQLWHEKVWLRRKNLLFHRKSLLMLDSAPGHRTDDVKNKFASSGTLIAMIPGGLTKNLQVLDISVNKSFKSHLRNKWEQWMINGYEEYTKSGNLKRASYQEVAKWISEAWEEVPVETIKNGFKKTTIKFYGDENNNDNETDYEEIDDDDDDGNNSDVEKSNSFVSYYI